MIRTPAIENYRSLRQVVIPLAALNLVTGANGSGKSSLHRATSGLLSQPSWHWPER